jgi:hypothetical protein
MAERYQPPVEDATADPLPRDLEWGFERAAAGIDSRSAATIAARGSA